MNSSNGKVGLKQLLYYFVFSFKISFRAGPVIFMVRLLLALITPVIPIINMLSIKNITNALVLGQYPQLLYWFIVFAALLIILAVINKIMEYFRTLHEERIMNVLKHQIVDIVRQLDVSYFDTPEYYNELLNVVQDVGATSTFIWTVFSIMQTLIQLILSFFIIFNLGWWAGIVIAITTIPSFIIDKKYALKLYKWSRDSANTIRKIQYYYDTMTSKYFAKDTRIHHLFDHFKNKYQSTWQQWYQEKKDILKYKMLSTVYVTIIPNLTILGIIYMVINKIMSGVYLVGDLSYYIGIINQFVSGISSLINSISSSIQQRLKLQYFESFRHWKPRLKQREQQRSVSSFESLEFVHVGFTYPKTDKAVLSDVSFIIRKGEKVGVVGVNGSGKTTIVKLILRLYDPTEGQILLNGMDIGAYNLDDYHRLFSSMMQEYVNYAFSLKENLHTTNIREPFSQEQANQAYEKSSITSMVSKWVNGEESFLTKSFDEEGVELSTGQWQRIAIARMFYKQAPVYIMDEPSSSLDIEGEYHIFKNFFHNDGNITLLLISHKLYNLHLMDKIILLDNGSIQTVGTHDELMKENGTYAYLYNLQLSKYGKE